MDFSYDERTLRLEDEVTEFLDEHLPPALAEEVYRSGVSHDDGFAAALAEKDWIFPGWDPQGRAADIGRFGVHVLDDRLTKVEAPTYALQTTQMVTSVLEQAGNEWMQQEIVPKARKGEITIALGMTEPECGSDVAAVQTKARRDGDEWVIDGQKMFTTNGHITDYVFLLTRTNPDVPNHKGLTMFLVPLNHPGVEAQAVFTLSGERTNIMFFSDVRIPDQLRIGEVDAGWQVLMISLQDEHSACFSPHLARVLDETEAWAAETLDGDGHPMIDDVDVQERLMRAATDLEVAQLLEVRVAWMEDQGQIPVAEGPMAKLYSTESIVKHTEQLAQLVGPDALRSKLDPTAVRNGEIEHGLRFSLGSTIYAGTSEVQRNIIAQRRCGLPR
jgi:alkylation response protein AidB-like acyl-CoA dehydrogenase